MIRESTDSTTAQRKTPSRITLGWSPFHTAAMDYYKAGYLPIPLPLGMKSPPPSGTPNDIDYTNERLANWLAVDRARNIGSIVPDGIVVLDIDGLAGQESLAELEKELGELPRTWISFRGDPDRYHLWFSTAKGLIWPGKLGAGLDVIYRHYRYMVVPPSIHPDGSQYRWANMRQGILRTANAYMPDIDEFSDLPNEWAKLATGNGYIRRDRANVDARLWITEHGQGELCAHMKRVLKNRLAAVRRHVEGGLHDAMLNGVWAFLSEIQSGHTGGYAALARLKREFIVQLVEGNRYSTRDIAEEWRRACVAGIEKKVAEQNYVSKGDPCLVEEAERNKSPDRFFDAKHGFKAQMFRAAIEQRGELAVGSGRTIYRYADGLWQPDGESEIYRRATKLMGDRYRPTHPANVLSVVGNRQPTLTDDSEDMQFLNLPNGLLDWKTGKLYEHHPSVKSTIRIPISWDEDAECPDIDQFLREVLPSDATELAYEILGYMLYNDNPLHKAILLYGSGRNGKGTFLRLARMLVGHNNISAVTPQALDSTQFSSAQLHGKLANLVGDVDPRIFKSTEQFKQLTGGDTMMAQHKHRNPFTFRCRALMIAAFNSLPRTADTTEGFFSRWVVIPFTGFFPAGVARTDLIDVLSRQGNLQGLLRSAVAGLQAVMRRQAFDLPASVIKATRRFKIEADPLRSFIEERVRFHHGNDPVFTPRTNIYNAYVAWAALNGFHQMSAQRFYESFTAAIADTDNAFVSIRRRNGIIGFTGFRIV